MKELTKAQKEYFKDSKVRDRNGDLLIVHHGSKTKGLNCLEWDPSRQTGTNFGQAYYFTTDLESAKRYAYDQTKDPKVQTFNDEKERILNSKDPKDWSKVLDLTIDGMKPEDYIALASVDTGGEVLDFYLDLQNPLIKNAQGKNYYDVYPEYFKEARENGHDGIIVVNINDTALGTPKLTDVFIAFYQDQFKSIDNMEPTHGKEFRNEGLDNKILSCKTLSGQLQVAKYMQTMNAKLSEELENDMKQPNRFKPGHKFPKLSIGDDEI